MNIEQPTKDDLSRDPAEDCYRFRNFIHTAPGFRSAHEVGLSWIRRAVKAEQLVESLREDLELSEVTISNLGEENASLRASIGDHEAMLKEEGQRVAALEIEVRRLTKELAEKATVAVKPKPIAEAS